MSPLKRLTNPLSAPFRHGGNALRKTAQVSPSAYFASVAQATSLLHRTDKLIKTALADIPAKIDMDEEYDPATDPDFQHGLPRTLIHAHTQLHDRIYTNFINAPNVDVKIFPPTRQDLVAQVAEHTLPTTKLQRLLTHEIENATHKHHLNTLSRADRKRTASLSSCAAVSVHQTHPVLARSLPSSVTITTNKLRMGTLKLPDSTCACGAPLSTNHALSCKTMHGIITRHDVLVKLIHSMMRECGIVARKEEFMDIVIYGEDGERIWVDISVINPEAPTYINQARKATETREQAKNIKYLAKAQERGITFIPAAIDVYGATGNGMDKLLRLIATSAYKTHPWPFNLDEQAWTGRFCYLLRKRVAHTLAFGNHLILEEAAICSTLLKRARTGIRATAAKKRYEILWKETTFHRDDFEA